MEHGRERLNGCAQTWKNCREKRSETGWKSDEWRKGENGHYHMRHECKWALSCTIYNLPEEENERALARWLSTWTDSKVFVQWLNNFIDAVKPTPAKKVVLFVDGHISHKSLEAVELARANGVELISFPPHTTHRLQPLDKCFFGPLKEYYRQACDYWMTSNTGKRITFYNIAALFGAAYTRACTIDKAVSGFSSCGLGSFNPAVFRDADFAPSLMTDIIEQATRASSMPAVTVPTEIVAPEPLPSSARVKATNRTRDVA